MLTKTKSKKATLGGDGDEKTELEAVAAPDIKDALEAAERAEREAADEEREKKRRAAQSFSRSCGC